jgi:hypothetical protein
MHSVLTRSRSEGCVSDLRFDRLIAGELDLGAERVVRDHVAGCALCAARLAEIEAAAAAFIEHAPPLPGRVIELRKRRPKPAWLASTAGALAAAAALVVWARVHAPWSTIDPSQGGDVADSSTRTKGAARLGLYIERRGAVIRAQEGDTVHPDDRLQFTVTSAEGGFLAVIGVDGASAVTVYYPSGLRAEAFDPGTDLPLGASTILDATLGREVDYGLFCKAPIELEPVRRAFAARPDDPPIPAGCRLDRLHLVKVKSP